MRACMHACMHRFLCVLMQPQDGVAGGEGVEGVYGTMTAQSTMFFLNTWVDRAGFCESSVMLDIGSGLGRWVGGRAVQVEREGESRAGGRCLGGGRAGQGGRALPRGQGLLLLLVSEST